MWTKYYNTDVICSDQEDTYTSSFYRSSECPKSFDGTHSWKLYQGFVEDYYFCTCCDKKESIEEHEEKQPTLPY